MIPIFSLAEVLALLSGVGYALLVVRRNRWAWACGAFSSGLLTVLAARNGLPLQSALQGVYLFMAGYGFWHWSRSSEPRVEIARWPWGWHGIALLLIAGATLLLAPWLAAHTDAAWPRLDALVTLLSLFATWMTARAVLENWVYWLFVDAVSFYLYFAQGLQFVALLYVLYFLIALWGLRSWWMQHRHDRLLPSGGHNRLQRMVHFFDERVRREWADVRMGEWLGVDIEVEVAAQRLAAAQGLAPQVLRFDRRRRRLWMPYLKGTSLSPRWFTQPQDRARMWELLDQLRSIEAVELPLLDLAERAEQLHGHLRILDLPRATQRQEELARTLAEWRAAGCAHMVTPCLVHGDLSPPNVLVIGAGSSTTGSWQLIDWEYAHRGHPLEDLAGLIVASGVPVEQWRQAHPPPGIVSEAQWRDLAARIALRRLIDGLWSDVAEAAGRRADLWYPQSATGKLSPGSSK